MLNKKIASELAIGIIVILSIAVGSIFIFQKDRQLSFDNVNNIVNIQKKKQPVKNNSVDQASKKSEDVVNGVVENVCAPHMYQGEAAIKGSYVLSAIPGSTKKEWLFKVADEDVNKLPPQAVEGGKFNGLLFIADAAPATVEKLKKATTIKPGTITIKRFYLDCSGVPVASVESEGDGLLKYVKKG